MNNEEKTFISLSCSIIYALIGSLFAQEPIVQVIEIILLISCLFVFLSNIENSGPEENMDYLDSACEYAFICLLVIISNVIGIYNSRAIIPSLIAILCIVMFGMLLCAAILAILGALLDGRYSYDKKDINSKSKPAEYINDHYKNGFDDAMAGKPRRCSYGGLNMAYYNQGYHDGVNKTRI